MSVPPPYGNSTDSTREDRLLALLAYVLGAFLSFVAPLAIYLLKKDQSRFVAFHALQALFFHIAINVLYLVLIVTVVGMVLWPIVGLVSLIFTIIAALAANRGEWYEIPVVGPFTRRQVGL